MVESGQVDMLTSLEMKVRMFYRINLLTSKPVNFFSTFSQMFDSE